MISPRHLLFVIATFGLIAVLAFLYHKTEAVNLSERNEIVALLRQLQEIEGRWDMDLLQMRTEMDTGLIAAPQRNVAAQNALRALANAMPHANSPSLSENLATITKAITEKAGLVEQFKVANDNSKVALRTILSIAEEPAEPEVSEVPGEQKTKRKSTARQRELAQRQKEIALRQKEFSQTLNQVAAAASGFYWQGPGQGQDAQRSTLESTVARVMKLSAGMDELTLERAAAMQDAVQALITSKPIEQNLAAQVSLLTSGPRLDGLVLSFNRELEATLDEKERFRVYMIAYAAALLIGIGYLGIRIVAANETLEHRVAERTSELSDALRHLKESEAQLIQSEKMSSLGQMVAGVAHEINTPLAYVSNSLNAVNDRLPEITSTIANCEVLLGLLNDPNVQPDELNQQFALVASQLEQIRQHGLLSELSGLVTDGIYGTAQVSEIVSNLKDFSRLDRSKVSSFNLNDGLNSTLGLARHLLKSIKVNKAFRELPAITCAPSQINQVFLNLITNAAQALPPENGEITLATRSDSEGVTVEVSDNGSGIPPEVIPKIFDPFFTTKEIGKGTGLGLSISYQIIKDHGGRLDVESWVGRGTKFTVWLPLKPPSDIQSSSAISDDATA